MRPRPDPHQPRSAPRLGVDEAGSDIFSPYRHHSPVNIAADVDVDCDVNVAINSLGELQMSI